MNGIRSDLPVRLAHMARTIFLFASLLISVNLSVQQARFDEPRFTTDGQLSLKTEK